MKEQWQKLRAFYRGDLDHYLFITAWAFVILAVLGWLAGMFIDGLAEKTMESFAQMVSDSEIMDDSGAINVLMLFWNNVRATVATAIFGFIPFLYLTAISLATNASTLGIFAAVYVDRGTSLLVFFASLVPHGIFELPALVLSMACGLYLCRVMTDYVRFKKKGTVGPAVLNVARVMALNVVPLLAAAAIIETYVTPAIVAAVMNL